MLRIILAILAITSFSLSETANAQYMYANAGIGLYGGMAGCAPGGEVSVPEGVADIQDDINEKNDLKKELRDQKEDIKDQIKTKKGDLERYKRGFEKWLRSPFSEAAVQHASTRSPEGWKVNDSDDNKICESQKLTTMGKQRLPSALTSSDLYCEEGKSEDLNKRGMQAWPSFVKKSEQSYGKLNGDSLCNDGNVVQGGPARLKTKSSSSLYQACLEASEKYAETDVELADLTAQLEAIDLEMKSIDLELSELRRNKTREMRRAQRDAEKGIYETEADGGCPDGNCRLRNAPKLSGWDKATMIIGGALGAYLNYRIADNVVDTNARLGWPTSPYIAYGMGAGPLMAGIYGATYGGGVGGFGCNGGAAGPYGMYGPGGLYGMGSYPNMGGAFGYPTGWNGGLGGGMYMPGMGPWGMAGPWGSGYPWMGGVPMMGFLASGIGGFMMPGMMAPGMMNGMMMPGMMASGIAGVMTGMMMPFSPYVGTMGPMASGIGMAISGYMMPGMMSSMMQGGLMMPMSGMMMNGMMNGMMMGNMMGYNMQYYQMMMQTQMQMQQQMQAMQMQAYQQEMMKQQTLMRLQGDLSRIYMMMNQVAMGGGMTFYGGGGGGYYPGMPSTILPLPGTSYGSGYSTYAPVGSLNTYGNYSNTLNGTGTLNGTTGGGVQGRGRWTGQ